MTMTVFKWVVRYALRRVAYALGLLTEQPDYEKEQDEEYEEEADCLDPCPECMSRRVWTLDGVTQEYECQNCGHTYFTESATHEAEGDQG